MTIIDYKVEDGCAILTWDEQGQPMNVLNGQSLAELDAGVKRALADDAVKGIVLTSGKTGIFVAGGVVLGTGAGRLEASVITSFGVSVFGRRSGCFGCGLFAPCWRAW